MSLLDGYTADHGRKNIGIFDSTELIDGTEVEAPIERLYDRRC